LDKVSIEKKTALDWVVHNERLLAEMGDTIWLYAEPGLREYKSAKYLADFLKESGFEVEMDIADLGPSSFLATYGTTHVLVTLRTPCPIGSLLSLMVQAS
jgi:metal-dependent amidase/aminoacylase/carboxypeptidase family protein